MSGSGSARAGLQFDRDRSRYFEFRLAEAGRALAVCGECCNGGYSSRPGQREILLTPSPSLHMKCLSSLALFLFFMVTPPAARALPVGVPSLDEMGGDWIPMNKVGILRLFTISTKW